MKHSILESLCEKIQRRFLRAIGADKKYLANRTSFVLGYKVDLDNPRTFNEKMAWIKLYDHNPLYHTLVDKYAVKEVVASKIGWEHVAKPLKVFDSYKEFDFSQLPAPPFVIKSVHYGTPIVIRKKSDIDKVRIMRILKKQSSTSGYKTNMEWGYKDVKPRVLVEEYLSDGSEDNILNDYKFWCFNGKVRCMYFTCKYKEIYENFYDRDFNVIDIDHGFPRHKPEFERPVLFNEMINIAEKLSEGIPFVRVDLYSCGDKIYFGEYTFFDWGGMHAFRTYEMDLEIGSWLELPKEKRI